MNGSATVGWQSRAERFHTAIGFSDSGLFTVTVLPLAAPCAAVVVCPSLLHDLLRDYRREVLLARRLANHGIAVVRFHYRATGNSLGDDDDNLVFADLVTDARDTLAALLSEQGEVPAAVFGARFGAFVAAALAAERPSTPLALWDPVPDAARWLKQVVRDERIAALVDRQHADPSLPHPPDRASEGERLPPRLREQCETLELGTLVGPNPGPLFVAELSAGDRRRSTEPAVDALRRVAPDVAVVWFPDEGSWTPGQRTPRRENPMERWPLLDQTVKWLDQALCPQSVASRP